MSQEKCKKSSGKRMTAAQKSAKKLAGIMNSSHWVIVTQWEGFVPFSNSELLDELAWACQQLVAFQEAKAEAKAKAEAEAKAAESVKAKEVSQLRKELKLQQEMLKEERAILSRQTTEDGRTARARNVEILISRCQGIKAEIESLSIRNWKEWTSVPVKPLGFTVAKSAKPKPKLKHKSKPMSQVKPKPVTKAQLKAFRRRKAEEARLQRVENAARAAAKKAAAEYVAQRVQQEVKAAKAKAAAERARRKAMAERRKAQEEALFERVFELTLSQFDLDRLVREEVARQLAAA